jgi:hypothetical protein
LRRVGWSILAIIAPELVALNAWLQYRRAKRLMKRINGSRGLDPPLSPRRTLQTLQRLPGLTGAYLGKAVIAVLSIPDWLRMIFRHHRDMRTSKREQRQARIVDLHTQMDKDTIPWTLSTAFYAISGAVLLESDHEKDLAILDDELERLATKNPTNLIPIQRAALQDPGRASGLAKMITCTQAFWFCSQCIARLSQNLAISLIELNTFAHCISAFFIYGFWWHKPYEVESHLYLNSIELLQDYLLIECLQGTHIVVGYPAMPSAVISARNSDGLLFTIVTAMIQRITSTRHLPSYRTIKYGSTIPGTGFSISLCSDEGLEDRRDILISVSVLPYWERLWCIRSSPRFSPQIFEARSRYFYARPSRSTRTSNFEEDFFEITFGESGKMVPIVLTLTFLIYGGVHLLAWQYNFQTNAEGLMWRISSTVTASSGFIFVFFPLIYEVDDQSFSNHLLERLKRNFGRCLLFLFVLLVGVDVLSRFYLVIESLRALPNSPPSVYDIPRWTAYLPHI